MLELRCFGACANRTLMLGLTVPSVACALGERVLGQELSYARAHQMLPSGPDSRSASGDVDSDGDADIVSGSFLIVGLENTDQGRFTEFLRMYGPEGVESLADFDSDGDADLLTVEPPSFAPPFQALGVWINPGGGAFTAPTSLLRPTQDSLEGGAVGDLDGDGDLDVYGYAASSGSIALDTTFMNTGSGTFVRRSLSLPPANRTEAVDFGDVDGDGDLDVLRYGGLQTVVLWLNDGASFFAPAAVQPPLGAGLGADNLRVDDLDLDGDADFLVGNPPRLLENEGSGTFVDAGPIVSATGIVFLADADGDRAADVTLQAQSGVCALYLNREGGFVAAPGALPGLALSAGSPLFTDVDRDEDIDLLGTTSPFPRLWLNDGRGRFDDVSVDPWEDLLQSGLTAVGHLDGDRLPDLVCVQNLSAGSEVLLLTNDGKGGFSVRTTPFSLPRARRMSLLDVDGDGDQDLLILASTLVLLEAVGPGEFCDASQNFPAPLPSIVSYAVGDVDGDGDTDVLTTDGLKGQLWLNDGSGVFSASKGPMPVPLSTFDMQLSDVDGDDDLDLWVGSPALAHDYLWLFDDLDGFVDASSNLRTTAGPSEHGVFVDLEGDGDADLLTVRAYCLDPPLCAGHAETLLNDGSGLFSSVPGLWENPWFISDFMAAVDLDSDGDTDVLGGCYLWINDGQGNLADASSTLPYCPSPALVAADLDLDRDVDLVNQYPLSVVASTQRHVSWRSYPRAGKPLTMEVFGPAGTPFQLFSSPRFTEPRSTDLGFLRLPTNETRLVATGTLDAEGKAAVTLGVPSDLALPENTLYWQAVVGAPPRLTNLELTRFSSL
jgi:hypothetical protein